MSKGSSGWLPSSEGRHKRRTVKQIKQRPGMPVEWLELKAVEERRGRAVHVKKPEAAAAQPGAQTKNEEGPEWRVVKQPRAAHRAGRARAREEGCPAAWHEGRAG